MSQPGAFLDIFHRRWGGHYCYYTPGHRDPLALAYGIKCTLYTQTGSRQWLSSFILGYNSNDCPTGFCSWSILLCAILCGNLAWNITLVHYAGVYAHHCNTTFGRIGGTYDKAVKLRGSGSQGQFFAHQMGIFAPCPCFNISQPVVFINK